MQTDRLAVILDLACLPFGESHGGGQLYRQLELEPRLYQALLDLLLGYRHDVVNVPLLHHHLEAPLADRGGPAPVRDGLRRALAPLERPGLKGPTAVVGARRLSPDDPDAAISRLGGQRRAAQQAAPADRGDYGPDPRV